MCSIYNLKRLLWLKEKKLIENSSTICRVFKNKNCFVTTSTIIPSSPHLLQNRWRFIESFTFQLYLATLMFRTEYNKMPSFGRFETGQRTIQTILLRHLSIFNMAIFTTPVKRIIEILAIWLDEFPNQNGELQINWFNRTHQQKCWAFSRWIIWVVFVCFQCSQNKPFDCHAHTKQTIYAQFTHS